MRAQVANLVVSGSSKAQILSIVDISEAALDEILKDPEFVDEIKAIRESRREATIDEELAKLELSTIKTVKEQVSMMDAANLCRVLDTVARTRQLKKSGPINVPNNGMLNPTINIAVPVFLGNSQVVLDSKRQVVAIDGRNMAPLPTAQVKQLFSGLEKGDSNEPDPILADLAEREAAEAGNRAAA